MWLGLWSNTILKLCYGKYYCCEWKNDEILLILHVQFENTIYKMDTYFSLDESTL